MTRSIVPPTAALLLALLAAAPSAHAAAPVARLAGSASLSRFRAAGGGLVSAARFHVTATFATDTPGAPPFTIQRAVVYYPDHAGTNGRLFPSCDAARIERLHGDVRRCPRGAQIGGGTVTARVLQLGVTAHGRVALLNSHRGRSVTFNVHTIHPAQVDESFDAALTQLHGRYGEKLTLVVPRSLQEVIPGVFVGVQRFDVTIGGAVRVRGVDYSFLRARRCPRRPVHGVFDFKDWSSGQTFTTTADAKVRCNVG